MMQTFVSMFKNKEIRNKILFTLVMLLIYRIGSAIPVPGVDAAKLSAQVSGNSILSMMNLLGGGAFEKMSVFALGVTPYITASIIIQLLSMLAVFLSYVKKDIINDKRDKIGIIAKLWIELRLPVSFFNKYKDDLEKKLTNCYLLD